MRYCEQCDYAIADPAITTCPRCGWPVESNAAWQTPDAGPPYSSPRYEAPPPGYAPPSMPFGSGRPSGAPYVPYAPPPYPQQPPPGYGYGGYPGYGYGGYPDYRETGYPATHPAYPGYANPPAPAPRRRTVGPITVLIVTLLVVLAGGSVAIARLANSQSSVHYSASASATATAAAAAGILYQNSFASDATGWSNSQNCFLGAGGYHVNTRTCFAPIGNQTNVDVTVQVKQISGQTVDPYGLVVRADGPPSNTRDQRYEFNIGSDGKWDSARCDGVGSNGLLTCTELAHATANDAIRGGLNVTNTLEVKAQGPHFDFYVNGVKVGSVSDSTYASGKVGLATGQNVECVFTNLTVKALS